MDSAGKIRVYGNRSGIDDTATQDTEWVTLTEENEKQCITALAYTLYQASLYEQVYTGTGKNGGHKWENGETFTKDLSDDSRISGWSKLYNAGGNSKLMQIKQTISNLMIKQYDSFNNVDEDEEIYETSVTDIFGKYAEGNIEYVYSGVRSGYGWGLSPTYGGRIESTGEILSNAMEEAENQVEEPTYTKEDKTASIYYNKEQTLAYIGPFALNYTSGTPSIAIDGVSADKIRGYTRKDNNGFGEAISAEELPSNSDLEFYVVVDADAVKDTSNVKVNVNLTYNTYRARMAFTTYPYQDQQNLMFFACKKYEEIISAEWEVANGKQISIQKVNASGNNIETEGIKFYIYNSSNEKVGELTTDEKGKTNVVKLTAEEEYTIKEVTNSLYGYKGCAIADAKIISGNGIVEIEDGEVKVKITEDTVISISNESKLGQLTIHKVGKDSENLEGVGFLVYRNNAYLKLGTGTTPVVTKDSGTDASGATFVNSWRDATVFKTNSSGKIVLNNLEIYSASGTGYVYWIYETANNNYGYKNFDMDNIEITGGTEADRGEHDDWYCFTITSATAVTVKNTKQLGNLEISKTGANSVALSNVEFIIGQSTSGTPSYLRLIKDSKLVEDVTSEIDITGYTVEYTTDINTNKPTIFKTNISGKITIKNLEKYYGQDKKYNYWVREMKNDNWGYNGIVLKETGVKIDGGTLGDANGSNKTGNVDTDSKLIRFTINSDKADVKITIENERKLKNVEIEKSGLSEVKLEDVEFIIGSGNDEYLQLKDSNGAVASVKGEVSLLSYTVEYVASTGNPTKFKTNSDGKIIIKDLEENSSVSGTYSYTAYETKNPNYGYGAGANAKVKVDMTGSKVGKSNSYTATNEKALGNISIAKDSNKHDTDYSNIKLSDVEFVIKASTSANTTNTADSTNCGYLALYDKDGKIVNKITGNIKINDKNVATKDGKEYSVKYYSSTKEYNELSNDEKTNITTFITGTNGELVINNLEKYQLYTGEEYKYEFIEIFNPYNGYDSNVTVGDITVENGETTEEKVSNTQTHISISGYAWLENPTGKANKYDNIYHVKNDKDTDKDLKLTDLYVMSENKLTKNEKAKIPVEIKLRNKNTKEIIKGIPDEFKTDGTYTFNDIEIANLANYEVVFVYDGVYYTTVVENTGVDNGSKAKEVASDRENLNNLFGTVKYNSEVIATNNKDKNTVKYNADGTRSFDFDTKVTATTSATNYDLADRLHSLKTNAIRPVEVIENINIGIITREQPKILVSNDVNNVLVNFEGYEYNYIYDAKGNYSVEANGADPGLQFEEKYGYTQTFYTSDIMKASEAENNEGMKVSITYKIKLENKSSTLTIKPKEIINYFDSRYTIKSIQLGEWKDGKIEITKNNLKYSEAKDANLEGYKSTMIEVEEELLSGQSKYVLITFEVEAEAIKALLQESSTYHNATEIMSYSTYYGENTGKHYNDESKKYEYFISDQTAVGSSYAGIDKESQPGNMELKLVERSNGDGTKVLDESKYEPDTDSAPSLLLTVGEVGARMVSGSIWEDLDKVTSDDERIGNGILDSNEKAISNVKVELYKVNDDGSIGEIALYSDGNPVRTVTDDNGKYTFGKYKEDKNGKVTECYGILPGKYVIKYTYNNESYIVGGENISVNDYKSTIISSEAIESTLKNQTITYTDTNINKITINNENITYNGNQHRADKWFVIKQLDAAGKVISYSDAVDNITLRKYLDKDVINYSNSKDIYTTSHVMNSYTPIMNIGIEFTEDDKSNSIEILDNNTVTFKEYMSELTNIDFGIIRRPEIDITIEKEITGIGVTTSNGMNIISIDNAADFNTAMQGVKKLDGLVSAEIESSLLQSAVLRLEYTISVENNSQTDYKEDEYYYYGRGGSEKRVPKVEKVVDYLDGTILIDEEKNPEGVWQEVDATTYLKQNGYINEDVHKALTGSDSKYHILMTEQFKDAIPGAGVKTAKLYAVKSLAAASDISEANRVEIIELSGGRTMKNSTPGNYVPVETEPLERVSELDEDRVDIVITPPTGSTVNYTLYVIATIVTFTILVIGIVVIKKKVVK